MANQTKNLSEGQVEARRKNARQSTGPRTRRGKRHSSRNALKHGLYADVRFFYWDAAMELGEDPSDFQRLFAGLVEARRPADTLEQVLVEDIAVLVWKKARLERAESAVQVSNVRKHDLERRRQYIQVGREVTTVPQAEVLEKGLRGMLDAPGKFEKVISMLGLLEDLTARNEFNDDMHRLLLALYGEKPTLRGVGLLNQFVKLRKMRPEGQEFENAKTVFVAMQAEDTVDVLDEYDLFLHEHVENTRAARIAAMAPSHAQWAAIIRQQNALHRQLERKIRLLDEMQERRRRMGSATALLSRLAGLADPSSGPGTDAGVAQTPRRVSAGCLRQSPPSGQKRVDMPNTGTSAPAEEVGVAHTSSQSGQERVADMPNTGTSASSEDQGRNEKNIQNSGNEAKKSLKTNGWVRMEGAKQARFGAPKEANEANQVGFLGRDSHPRKAQRCDSNPQSTQNYTERHELWHGRPARAHGRDGRARL